MCPVIRFGFTEASGVPGFVSRCRTTRAEWHIMSLSTPPPCSRPCQNHGMCGPLCSSAARARYGRPVSAAELGISTEAFLVRFEETFALKHMLVGLGKAPVFAAVIALVGCLEGFKVAGTAQSVGERTTSSVVQAIMLVIVLDAIAAVFTMEMGW